RFFLAAVAHPLAFLRSSNVRHASEKSVILLVMRSPEIVLTTFRRWGRLRTKPVAGQPNPTWIPVGHNIVRRLAAKIGGDAHGLVTDAFDIPTTTQLVGGCVIGDGPESGVIDAYQRVFGYPGLHIADGSAVSANLGVHASLTITA